MDELQVVAAAIVHDVSVAAVGPRHVPRVAARRLGAVCIMVKRQIVRAGRSRLVTIFQGEPIRGRFITCVEGEHGLAFPVFEYLGGTCGKIRHATQIGCAVNLFGSVLAQALRRGFTW